MSTSRKKVNRDSGNYSSKTQKAGSKSGSPHSNRHQLYIKKGDSTVGDKNKETNKDKIEIVKNDPEKNEAGNKTAKKKKYKYQPRVLKEHYKEMRQERVEEKRKSFYEFLKEYEDSGARLSIGGRAYTAERISEIMSVAEPPWYMPDIKLNDEGKVININYDRISED